MSIGQKPTTQEEQLLGEIARLRAELGEAKRYIGKSCCIYCGKVSDSFDTPGGRNEEIGEKRPELKLLDQIISLRELVAASNELVDHYRTDLEIAEGQLRDFQKQIEIQGTSNIGLLNELAAVKSRSAALEHALASYAYGETGKGEKDEPNRLRTDEIGVVYDKPARR